MSSHATYRTSTAHHPRVQRGPDGGWVWACSCGGASCRTIRHGLPWKQAVIGALLHSATVAP
ncbi:hypothetical protein [Pedococcus sp. 5OH_020]|uniref:hypothetical protein n=1 Tax=Pedococcus sp. 5OH_020 TaxID=2989814 RepID=UPI0022E9D4D1|nr:hypothetical protein [Pedococcus sp. 5OH_020]